MTQRSFRIGRVHRPPAVQEDRALVDRMLSGDEDAFRQFVDNYFDRLYRFALSRLSGIGTRHNDQELAKELVQSTVCIAIEKLDTYRGEAALMTWLCGICRHQISAHSRYQQRWRNAGEPVDEAPEIRATLELLAMDALGPEDELRRGELVQLVHLTLDHLPPKYGRALAWKYFDGLPVKVIAERLQVGPKAAESILTRAREAFRKGFEGLTTGLSGDGYRGLRLTTAERSG